MYIYVYVCVLIYIYIYIYISSVSCNGRWGRRFSPKQTLGKPSQAGTSTMPNCFLPKSHEHAWSNSSRIAKMIYSHINKAIAFLANNMILGQEDLLRSGRRSSEPTSFGDKSMRPCNPNVIGILHTPLGISSYLEQALMHKVGVGIGEEDWWLRGYCIV